MPNQPPSLPPSSHPSIYGVPEYLLPKVSPDHVADNTKRIANQQQEELAIARAAIELSQQALAASESVERFTRRMSWASLWISIGSLVVALGSLAVAIVALAGQ